MDDFACPRCRTTKFQNPSLKMMVNVCGHGLCESCVDLLFLKGSGSCPECRIPLRRNNFRVQMFEDATVEKEVDIRRRVLRDFNKKEEDFASLREYNDYLEEVETIIYNLTNNIDIINTNKKIEQYKKDNRELIQKNKSRLGKDEYEIEEMLEIEKQMNEARKVEILAEESEAKKKKLQRKEALIDELMFSNTDAKNIVETFAQQVKEEKEEEAKRPLQKITKFSTGIEFGRKSHSTFLPVPVDDGPLYHYKPVVIEPDGPQPPSEEDIIQQKFINHIRTETEAERAGGFNTKIACLRALQEAMMGLYHTKKL
ncbi:CDK-activating kinase assembly factor MAT1 [Anthonomus grandis grandis]|uniref:CDK-activating kinase assembly factor MAT1 n=1 Tax=Anthonomus grandis grandis TaxID=2921223 RepID=UPI002165A867|nr:CDK-activating kinase assembly factor MAT1 [Anthonomus grandis grandis]